QTIPPIRLQHNYPPYASNDNDRADVAGTWISGAASMRTYKFSRTPRPLGVIGSADTHVIIGTITKSATGEIFRPNPRATARNWKTLIMFNNIENPRVRRMNPRRRPNSRQAPTHCSNSS